MAIQLFNAQASNGSSAWASIIGDGLINIYISGTMGGGTVTLEALAPDGSTYVACAGGAFTSAGLHVINAASFTGRVTLSGATSPSISVWIEPEATAERSTIRARTAAGNA